MAARAATGPAHVAVVSFLAARAAPTGGFWIALAGGVALARVAERLGARLGFGASAAAMLETVAIIGPARLGVPLTQAVSAPILGRLHARGVGFWPQLLACATVRLLHNAATTAFFIWVITGGLDAYAGTYDAVGRRVGIEVGSADALALTLAGLLVWAAFASTVQVLVYRRGLRAWPRAGGRRQHRRKPRPPVRRTVALPQRSSRGRFDPRAVAAAALVAFVLLLVEHRLGPARGRVWSGWRWPGCSRGRSESQSRQASSSPPSSLAERSPSRSAAASAWTPRSDARAGRRCWCSWPPGCGRPRGRSACARSRAESSAACDGCPRRPRPPRCSTRSPPRAASPPPAARSPRASRRRRSARPRCSTRSWPG